MPEQSVFETPTKGSSRIFTRLRWGGPAVLVLAGWTVALFGAASLMPSPLALRFALFAHLVPLVVGFGAVLTSDWHGLLWRRRLRTLPEVLRLISDIEPVIWLSLLLLLVTGTQLEPDLSLLRTWFKVLLVRAVGLNGLYSHQLHRRLESSAAEGWPGGGLLIRMLLVGTVSQIGWWGATIIGFLTTASSRY